MPYLVKVFGLPRSGTTWVANWLMTANVRCLHDPAMRYRSGRLLRWAEEEVARGYIPAISCTAYWMCTDVVATDGPLLSLAGNVSKIQSSLGGLGLPALPEWLLAAWRDFTQPEAPGGNTFSLASLRNEKVARQVWRTLLGEVPFDALRHAELLRAHIAPAADEIARIRNVVEHYRRVA